MNIRRFTPGACQRISSVLKALHEELIAVAELLTLKSKGRARPSLLRAEGGAVFVEFLIAFIPVLVFFLCVVQLGLLFAVRLLTEHAAVNAARALAVVGGDDPSRGEYNNEKKNVLTAGGERRKVVETAALLTMAPLILNGVVQTLDVYIPRADDRGGDDQTGTINLQPMAGGMVPMVRVRVKAEAACRLAIAGPITCRTWLSFLDPTRRFNLRLPTVPVQAEAVFPYQGASYCYENENCN